MSVQTEITRIESAKTAIATAIEGKGVTVPTGTKLDGLAALVESIEAGGGTIGGKKFISGEITFSETPTSQITISHDNLGFRSQPFVFLAANAAIPANNIGALISARAGSSVYVNSSKMFSVIQSLSETINYNDSPNDTSFIIQSQSAKKMLAGKTYIWFRIEL